MTTCSLHEKVELNTWIDLQRTQNVLNQSKSSRNRPSAANVYFLCFDLFVINFQHLLPNYNSRSSVLVN